MRRGGHGFKFQAPWRRHDDPTQSSIPFEQVEGLGFRRLVALAAVTLAMSMVMLQWRRHERSTRDLGASKPGFLFPLYGYSYRQYRHASTDSEGTLWRGRRGAAHHRALQQVDEDSGPFFKLRMQGPHGLYEAQRGSTMKCVGDTEDLCLELQDQHDEKCSRHNQYECSLFIQYADLTTIWGVFVTDSMTLPLQDKSEVRVHAYFGCGTQNEDGLGSVAVTSDGIIGLGNCKPTLAYQWFEKNLISQNVISFCIAKNIKPVIENAKIGYVAVGIDFNEKFEVGSSAGVAWAPLVQHFKRQHF